MPIIILFRKYTYKRARNMKLDSIFFTASAVYIRSFLQISKNIHLIYNKGSRYYIQ